ncbi:MAG: putative O-antigen transporter [Candidatus Heimdallarchaeota archaeon LC_2]|nr:MAG: putative O-antigen transporter [Candidatus Heimdallarchaeota archaeon LC_2]
MIRRIKKIFESEEKKTLLSNFISLSFLRGVTYLLPLITLPYLVRILGPEKYGLIAFILAFAQYFKYLTAYGFDLSATKEISINRNDREKISEIYSSVLTVKLLLTIISFIIYAIVVFSFNRFRQEWIICFLTYGIVLGDAIFPVWLFLGLERMKYITGLNIVSKIVFTVAIFVFIREDSDYYLVPLFNSLGFIIAGVLSLWLTKRDFDIEYKIPSILSIKACLIDGWHIFLAKAFGGLYLSSITFILGLLTNNTIVGYYSAAERIITAVRGFIGPVSQTVYPHISKVVNLSKEKGVQFIRKVLLLVGILTFILSVVLLVFSKQIVNVILGPEYYNSIIVIQILSFLPFITGLSNIFGIQAMLNFDLERQYSRIVILTAIISILMTIILSSPMKQAGAALTVLIAESFILVATFLSLQTNGIMLLGARKRNSIEMRDSNKTSERDIEN